MKKLSILLLAILMFASCDKEKTQSIDPVFQTYVDQFFVEANRRGLDLALTDINLVVQFGSVSNNAEGQCSFRRNTVTIDQTSWDGMNEAVRTWLIFHELGHCVLDRHHKNETINVGECLSLMKGREDGFQCSINYYSEQWWDYYLDELFDEETATPVWYANDEDISVGSSQVLFDGTTDELSINSDEFPPYEDYTIRLTFENQNTDIPIVGFFYGNVGFSHCNICAGTNVRIDSNIPLQTYFENYKGSLSFSANSQLTIQKIGDRFYFYVNEQFIHTFENSLWSGEQNLRTIRLDETIPTRLVFEEIE